MSTHDPRSDAELLRASAHDADAFGAFYLRHARPVADYFARRAGDRALVADLTSETFAEAFASRRRYRDTGASAAGWLFTIARRQLNEFYRTQRISAKYRNRLGVPTDYNTDEFDRVEEIDHLRQLQPRLEALLNLLSEPAAEAVVLRIGHGLPYQAVGAQLGCSPSAARVRVSRALHTMHEHLDRVDGSQAPAPEGGHASQGGNQ